MNSDKTQINPLGTENTGRLAARYAIPSVISLVVNSLYNMVDQVFIGQGVGYLGNAATNVIMPMTLILMAVAMMFANGASAYMSLQLGKGDAQKAAKGVGNMVTLLIGSGILFLILFEIMLQPVCYLFGARGEVMGYAMDYGKIIVLGFPVFVIGVGFGNVIRADGRPKASMAGMLIGCVTNMILDPIFIFVCKWGVQGAAWATIIGQLLNAVFYIVCLYRFQTIRLKRTDFIPHLHTAGRIVSLGMSSFFTQIASTVVIAVQNNLLVKYGARSVYGADIPMAALGITMKTSQLITSIAMGIASGVQPILGYNYGSRQYDRVKQTFKISIGTCTVIMFAALFVFQVFPEAIIHIFGQESELYMEFAVKCFRIYLLACFMIPSGMVIGIFYQAIGKPVPAMAISLSRQIVFLIPAMFILSAVWGIDGLLWSGPVSDMLSGVVAILVVRSGWRNIFEEKNVKKCTQALPV
ncbi:MATE family efflux transporter [bacterium 0.1xD8-71]|nr:MATE family efflux transporter [bacterium 0.1xD8-71]